ncbi:MAG: hypothetical protein HYV28_01525 [Ignavibacteriales bacterium]|nr:hypothetical protein [Ignavibacteriales bacterium]
MQQKKRIVSLGTFILVLLTVFIVSGCENEDERTPPQMNHKNAVEYYVTTVKVNGLVIVTTKKDIYSNFKKLKSETTVDTLPHIGYETFDEEDENGNTRKVQEPIAYDIYFRSEVK